MLQAAQPTCSLRIPGKSYRLKEIQQQEDLKWKESSSFRITQVNVLMICFVRSSHNDQ